jgi:hypothetical protein
MSIKYYDKSGVTPQEILLAGNSNTDLILNATSKNAIANKTVYAALQDKVEKAVNDLVYYYTKSDVYNKAETRALLSTISTMDIRVVNSLPVSDISTTTIYFLKPTGSQNYDEYVYVDNAWVKIGDTGIDLSQYLEIADFETAIADYYDKDEIDAMIASYYTKTQVDNLIGPIEEVIPSGASSSNKLATASDVAAKQDALTFDNVPTENSNNPVKSGGVYSALHNINVEATNENLLDNAWFTVNQRDFNDTSGGGTDSYRFDRWHGTYSYDATNKLPAFTGVQYAIQHLNPELKDFLDDKVLTVSILYSDDTLETGSITYKKQPSNWITVSTISKVYAQIGYNATASNPLNGAFCITDRNNELSIKAVKLEVGAVSTLLSEIPPEYESELAKCKTSIADIANDKYTNQGGYFLTKDNSILGARNLLPNSKITTTVGGVTYTAQPDGSYIVTGATSSDSPSYSDVISSFILAAGTYILSSPNTEITSDIEFVLDNITSGTAVRVATLYNSTAVTFTLASDAILHCYMWINKSITLPVGGVHFYPMIKLATDMDDTYSPYTMTNRELTDLVTYQDVTLTTNSSGRAELTADYYKRNIISAVCLAPDYCAMSIANFNGYGNRLFYCRNMATDTILANTQITVRLYYLNK